MAPEPHPTLPVAEPGYVTTEFWTKNALQVFLLVVAIVHAYQTRNADQFLTNVVGLMALLEGVYTVARSVRKKGTTA